MVKFICIRMQELTFCQFFFRPVSGCNTLQKRVGERQLRPKVEAQGFINSGCGKVFP